MKTVETAYGVECPQVPCRMGEGCGLCETIGPGHLIDGPAQRVTIKITDNGRRWRECLGPELDPAKLDPERLVWFGRENSIPRPAAEYADWRVAGHPFLHALCLLGIPIYLEER